MGKYGLKLSVISLRGWLTYGGAVDDSTAGACLDEAVNLEINFIDVADVYAKGKSEEGVGHFLQNYDRTEFVISSKVFGRMSDKPNDGGLSQKHISESIEKSLKRLQTDQKKISQPCFSNIAMNSGRFFS